MTPTAPVPDALLIPNSHKRGATTLERIDSILAIAEPILRVDRSRGQRAYLHDQDHETFASADRGATLMFPVNSPFRGRRRYRWVPGPDGVRRGYLTDLAREYRGHEPGFDPIALGLHRAVCRYGH